MTSPLKAVAAVLAGVVLGGAGWWWQYHAPGDPAAVAAAAAPLASGKAQKPAAIVADAQHAPILAAALAGSRIVAAGDHGVVLLSDDNGKSFRQAHAVPTQALLTSLSFVDDHDGWAAGHDGLVLHTTDGGETWAIQHEDLDGDKPLFAVHFKDAKRGFAVGLFGNAIQTGDGGQSWVPLNVETGEEKDHHLYGIFGDPAGALCIAGETGMIYRSVDGGATWAAIKTSNPGSFWTGTHLKDGSLLAAGQRGHVFHSRDDGVTWVEVPSATNQSLTDVIQLTDGSVVAVGLAGTIVTSRDGRNFTIEPRPDRTSFTAALPTKGAKPLLFGASGPDVVARQ